MISVISSSIRTERNSHRVALALQKQLIEREKKVSLVDLRELNFPLFNERLSKLESAPQKLVAVSKGLIESNSIILVTPEYNGGISAALKNVIDVFGENEFAHKRIGVATVSAGLMGGIKAALQLQQLILTISAWPMPKMLLAGEVIKNYDENGSILNENTKNKVEAFLNAFLQ
jgi:azobenzene reductase